MNAQRLSSCSAWKGCMQKILTILRQPRPEAFLDWCAYSCTYYVISLAVSIDYLCDDGEEVVTLRCHFWHHWKADDSRIPRMPLTLPIRTSSLSATSKKEPGLACQLPIVWNWIVPHVFVLVSLPACYFPKYPSCFLFFPTVASWQAKRNLETSCLTNRSRVSYVIFANPFFFFFLLWNFVSACFEGVHAKLGQIGERTRRTQIHAFFGFFRVLAFHVAY